MTVRFYSSTASEKQLVGTITSGQTTCVVSDTIGLPTSFPYTLALSYETLTEELVQVNSAAGTTLTIVRAIDGTSAVSHAAGARVRHVTSARDFADSRNHENADDGIHGLSPGEEIVGTDKVQTLSNKTFVNATGTLRNIEITQVPPNDLTITNSPAFGGTVVAMAMVNGSEQVFEVKGNGNLNIRNNATLDGQTTARRFQLTMSDGTTERLYMTTSGTVVSLPKAGTGNSNGAFIGVDPGGANDREMIAVRDVTNTTNRFVVYAGGAADITSVDPTLSVLDLKSAPAQSASMFRVLDSSDNTMVFVDSGGEFNAQRRVDVFNDNSPASTVLAVQGHTTQTGTLQSWRNGAGSTVARVRADGSSDFTPQLTPSGIITAASGWSVNAQGCVDKAGIATINLIMLRTGADIVALAGGNIADTPVGTISAAFRPNSGFGASSLTFAGTTGVGTGSVRVDASTGDVTLVTWSTGGTLQTGEGLQLTLTWPLNF